MPLNKKWIAIKKAMMEEYGKDKWESVFYASENKGTIKDVTKKKKGSGSIMKSLATKK